MTIDRIAMKREARSAMTGRHPSVYLVSFLFLAVNYLISSLTLRLQFPGLRTDDLMGASPSTIEELQAIYATLLSRMLGAMESRGVLHWLLTIALAVFAVMLDVGFVSYALAVERRREAGFFSIFDPFGSFFRVILLKILVAVLSFLWGLPTVLGYGLAFFCMFQNAASLPLLLAALALIVLGFVLSFVAHSRYSMAIYILLDDPDKTARTCVRESVAMTQGHKGELFVLDLSMLVWRIVGQLPFVSIFTLPYIETVWANYYRALSGRSDTPEHLDVAV